MINAYRMTFRVSNSMDYSIFQCHQTAGFGVFGKEAQTKNSLNEAIEELADDLESQQVKDIMGISEFGRKAKTFDITVSVFVLRSSLISLYA